MIWRPGYLYKWTGVRWVELPRPQASDSNRGDHAAKYWEAISDLTEGAPSSIISTGFMKTLLADEAFIKFLFAKYIELQTGGEIRSFDYAAGIQGFRLQWNGLFDLINGTITLTACT